MGQSQGVLGELSLEAEAQRQEAIFLRSPFVGLFPHLSNCLPRLVGDACGMTGGEYWENFRENLGKEE